jgi:hypothetical protein
VEYAPIIPASTPAAHRPRYGGRGVIEGRLTSEDTVEMRVLTGPLQKWPRDRAR